ncbi:MAG: type II toxin-antitoxin system PemK/MazF family toxin [Peptococcaceae bacterium]|nr:type II toxin-antitoxin system PemK/MazF family toxin [Peptococcaceae bacterium]
MKKCTINFGDIVLVPIAWSDKETGSKIRPAVVISRENLLTAGQIIVLGISSKITLRENEYKIINWRESGLQYPSKIWLSKPYSAPVKYATKIGRLPSDELLSVYHQFLSYI